MTNILHYCLQELHWKPSEFFALTQKEKAILIASCQKRAETEEKARKEAEQKAKARR